MTGQNKIFIYVQHLLGIGHLRRTSYLARELVIQGFEVYLVSGGNPVAGLSLDGVKFHQLPPLRSRDENFDILIDENGQIIDEDWKRRRSQMLLSLFASITPHMLITETFPFGRRMMRFELVPLLKMAKEQSTPPLIVSSIRDILQPKSKAGRNLEISRWLDRYYDQILVHGDESMATLGDSYPLANEVLGKTSYTGYITECGKTGPRIAVKDKEVLVSGGGGAVSLALLETAIAAKPLSSLNHYNWRVLVGHNIDEASFKRLQEKASDHIVIERNRPDFVSLLSRCAVSISQAGYNTVMDILSTGARAVLVPFSASGEIEQKLRADSLKNQKLVEAVEAEQLSARVLADAIDRSMESPLQFKENLKMKGAEVSAQLISGWLHA